MDREQFDRSIREPFKPNVVVVNHMSLCMSRDSEVQWMNWVLTNVMGINPIQVSKPHITIAYSHQEIQHPLFNLIDLEGEYFDVLDKPVVITSDESSYGVITDPHGQNFLVLFIKSRAVKELENWTRSLGAVWHLPETDPFIFIQKDPQYMQHEIENLTKPEFNLVFDTLRVSRFGEVIN